MLSPSQTPAQDTRPTPYYEIYHPAGDETPLAHAQRLLAENPTARVVMFS